MYYILYISLYIVYILYISHNTYFLCMTCNYINAKEIHFLFLLIINISIYNYFLKNHEIVQVTS